MPRKYKHPETWGAIRKLPSGRYQASYVGPDGVRYTAKTDAGGPLTFDTITDARAWLTDTRRGIQRGEWEAPMARADRLSKAAVQAEAHRFATYAESWLSQRRSSKGEPLRPKTRHEYQRQLTHGLAPFADDPLVEITTARVRAWHHQRAQLAPTSAGAESRLLRAILNTAITDDIITKNPVPTNLTRTTTGVSHRPPTLDELATILDAIEGNFRLAIILAAYGGLRLSEWRALRRSDLVTSGEGDSLRYRINVQRQAQYVGGTWVVGAPKSAEGRRIVPLPTAASADVTEHLAQHVGPFPNDLVFPSGGRSEFLHNRQFSDAFDVARKAAGVRVASEWNDAGEPTKWVNLVREHDLRAFAGTMHARSGATLRETMEFLGHSTTVAAMAYQATTGREAELADRMPMPIRGQTSSTKQMHIDPNGALQG